MKKNSTERNAISFLNINSFRKMKLILLFISFCFFQLYAINGYAQNTKISLELTSVTLSEAIKVIEEKTPFVFFFNNSEIDMSKQVSLNLKDASIKEVLNLLLTPGSYRIENYKIVLLTDKTSEEGKITGKVIDETGMPVIGANVIDKKTNKGTITDLNGQFILEASQKTTLTVSFIGYISQDIHLKGQKDITVTLKEDTQFLDEVVVVGYGIQKKRDVTGSISQIKGEELKNIPTANIANTMQGRVSGVEFVSGGGGPGNSPSIRIRGTGTINNADPLIIIDGIAGGSLRDYNPNDVESVEILKDASASAIYGTRAANGVIIITTKKGRLNEKISISLNAYTAFAKTSNRLNLLTAEELVSLKKERYTNNGIPVDSFWDNPYYSTQRTDWQDAYFTTGTTNNIDLSIKGGGEKSTFYMNLGYYNEKGTIEPSQFKRYSIRLNSDHQITKKLKIGQSFQFSLMNPEDVYGSFWNTLRYNPAIPVKNEDGSWGSVGGNRDYLGDLNNPVMHNNIDLDGYSNQRLSGTITLEYNILEGLYLKGNYGANSYTSIQNQFLPVIKNQPFPRPEAELRRHYGNEYTLIAETFLSYNKTIAKKHNVNISVGFSTEKYKGDDFGAERRIFSDESKDQQYLNNGQNIQNAEGVAKNENALASYFARGFYGYLDKYLLTVTMRADGSSKFAKGNRWGIFPAFSLGWRLSEESFIKNIDVISNLKLTGGWGSLGNQKIDDFQYLSTIEKGGGNWNMYNINGNHLIGSTLKQLGNPSITWEHTDMTNIAIDAGFFNNKLTSTLTYFDKRTKDMLLSTVEVGTLGLISIPPSNIGEMRNHGFEIEIGYNNTIGSDFQYNLGLNASFIKNKVTKLYGDEYIAGPGYGRTNAVISRTYEGQPLGSFYGWKTDGLYQNQAEIDNDPGLRNDDPMRVAGIKPGDVRFLDMNQDGKIDEADRVNLGHPHPKAVVGFTGAATYKGFDLSFNFTSNLGVKLYNADRMTGLDATQNFNLYHEALSRWRGEGTSNSIPRMTLPDYNLNNNYRVSDLFIEKGDYLMLKNLTVGYTLPHTVTSKIGINNLRMYLTGTNLFTITGYSGITPELGYSGSLQKGVDTAAYPMNRTFSIGFTLDL